jgi:hypothetical protein
MKTTESQPALLFEALPEEYAEAFGKLQSAIDARSDLVGRLGSAKAAEPAAMRAVADAADVLEHAETHLALATDEDAGQLTKARDRTATAADTARAELVTIQRRQRGLAAKIVEAETLIEAANLEWTKAHFRGELQLAFRRHLVEAGAAFVEALRVGWAIEAAMPRTLGHALREVKIPDVAVQPGRPVPYLVTGHQSWMHEDADLVHADLHDFAGVPGIAALQELLRPIGRAEAQVRGVLDAIMRARAARAMEPAAPQPQPPSPEQAERDRVQGLSDEEYRELRRAEIERSRTHPEIAPPGYVRRPVGAPDIARRG